MRKHYKGCYRIDLTDHAFGQVTKQPNGEWYAEIREVKTGKIIRGCWLWTTRRDAISEILRINPLDYKDYSTL